MVSLKVFEYIEYRCTHTIFLYGRKIEDIYEKVYNAYHNMRNANGHYYMFTDEKDYSAYFKWKELNNKQTIKK